MLADSETTYIWYMNYQLSLSIVIVRHFCRDVPRNINCHLSSDTRILRQVYTEAEYYLLDSLADIISSQLCILHMGHKEFLEEWVKNSYNMKTVTDLYGTVNSDCVFAYLHVLLI